MLRKRTALALLGFASFLLLTRTANAHTLSVARAKRAAKIHTATCKRIGNHKVRCTTAGRVITVTLRGRKIVVTRRARYAAAAAAAASAQIAAYPAAVAQATPQTTTPSPAGQCTPRPTGALMSYADSVAWLRNQAAPLFAAARTVNRDGVPIYRPDATSYYPGLWPRDFAYAVEAAPGVIPADDIAAGIRYLVEHQGSDGAIGDHINGDGSVQFGLAGPQPVTDGAQSLVTLVYEHYKITGSLSLYLQYRDQITSAVGALSRSSNGLIYVDPVTPSASYGFTDLVMKTGNELFTSLMLVKAERQLAELAAAAGADPSPWQTDAERVRDALGGLYDPASGMFLAATRDNRQIDVWGSAFAVAEGIATPAQAQTIRAWLAAHYDEIVYRGQVRHLPGTEHWQRMSFQIGYGYYQNGAFWGVASGWVAAALRPVAPELAQTMIRDLVADYRANGITEWSNGREACAFGVRDYMASLLPLRYL